MGDLARESKTIHDILCQQVQQGRQNQQAQSSHAAETVRLREEMGQMKTTISEDESWKERGREEIHNLWRWQILFLVRLDQIIRNKLGQLPGKPDRVRPILRCQGPIHRYQLAIIR